MVTERERIKEANEGVKPKKQEPQTVSSPVTASIVDPKIIDPATGKPAIYQGENFNVEIRQGRADFAKLKEDRIQYWKERIKQQQDLLNSGWKPENLLSGKNPGAHAEVQAFDKTLKAREAAGLEVNNNTIDELYLHNRSLLKNQYPNSAPKMYDHCKRILDGVNPIGHE